MSTAVEERNTLYFIGVSTSQSKIMALFPRWSRSLGLGARIVGYDIEVDAPPRRYHECLDRIVADPSARGALVTTHKAAMFEAAADRFSVLDPLARLCREISCVTVRGGSLHGWAKDPVTAGQALDAIVGVQAMRDVHTVICFGAGGSGVAITAHLLGSLRPPSRIVLVDRDSQRISVARSILSPLDTTGSLKFLNHEDTSINDSLLAEGPAGTLVINATGMGKDRPGAPISQAARFPKAAVVWELNYRGSLDFLRIAHEQAEEGELKVVDGWQYFLHGWTEVIAEVFDTPIDAALFSRLRAIAETEPSPIVSRRDCAQGRVDSNDG